MPKSKILGRSRKKRADLLLADNRFAEAGKIYAHIVRADRTDADAWVKFGIVQQNLDRPHEAERCWRSALKIEADNADALYALGVHLQVQGRLQEAIPLYHAAVKKKPDQAETHYHLGDALRETAQFYEALNAYREAVRLRPGYIEALNNFAAMLTKLYWHDEAIGILDTAVPLTPEAPQLWINLGRAHLFLGRMPEAVNSFTRAVTADPDMFLAHSNLVTSLNYLPSIEPEEVFAAHRKGEQRFAIRVRRYTTYENSPDPQRCLRIGYVSPDFRSSPVASFFEGVLAKHDSQRVQVVCYAEVYQPDSVTERMQALAHTWRSTCGISDDQVAEQIRADGIDVLVDLAGHTTHNRLMVFARKPAPVQVTYLGYPNTTGLACVDYRFTDQYADPPGTTESFHSEELVRLAHGFLCYRPPPDAPPPGSPPCVRRGGVTFGSFNNLAKVTSEVIDVWSRILAAVPESRLLLKSHALLEASAREFWSARLAEHGIARERTTLLASIRTHHGHLQAYNRVDIALDSFPYNGTTTSCEALWMGVPVVTLAGRVHAARVGCSILSHGGFSDWIAADVESYIEKAVGLAKDKEQLIRLRETLRERLAASSLCDAAGFVRDLEKAYRKMWSAWWTRIPGPTA
ncbi:MAG: tetratricopeptide repeat protein [Gammaproteobacteria bacterium]